MRFGIGEHWYVAPVLVTKICVYLKVGKYIHISLSLSLSLERGISLFTEFAFPMRGDFLIYTVARLRV